MAPAVSLAQVPLARAGADDVGTAGGTDPVVRLAVRWARLAAGDDAPGLVEPLTTLLRKLATMLRAEPFWPLSARALGVELVTTGLWDRSGRAASIDIGNVVAPVLQLLRREAPAALGLVGPDAERRVSEALDEMTAGLFHVLHHRSRPPVPEPGGAELPSGEHERHIRAVYSQVALGVGLGGLGGEIFDMNPALCGMLGLPAPLTEPRPVSDFVHPDDLAEMLHRLRRLVGGRTGVARMELRLVRSDSQVLWVHSTASLVLDDRGAPSHLMVVVEDVSQRHRLGARLQAASYQDQLTRLPHQAVVEQWLDRAVGGAMTRIGICSLDVDRFHLVNEQFGQQVGDRLLLGIAGRLQLAAGDNLVARTGPDEFTVLVGETQGVAEVGRFADRLQAALAVPFHIDGHVLPVSVSIGVTEGATARASGSELVRAADVARSWAVALGGGRRIVFDPTQDAAESARFALLSGLPGAIDRGEFRLAFQPLVRLADGQVQGAEALVRWQHPEHGLIGPGRFIELAECSGAIVPLGRWVLEAACAQAATWWRELGPDAPFVSVNVSPVQLAEAGWPDEVTEVLAATGLPAHRLQLEITEQAVLGDLPAAIEALGALRSAGVRLALDDFGTGYSSLAWLRRLPVHAIKIDGAFIDGLRHPAADPTDSSIVEALIRMAHAMGLEVTAEWVETPLQADRLAALGCDLGQGRWFGDAGPGEWVPGLFARSIGR